eukprot:scaffold2298_cov104-Skeletonema_dohrnii-CCMP3373.AAC.8
MSNENTADVCFEVSSVEEKEDDCDDRTKRAKTSTSFYAHHRLVLRGCAPILAAICGSSDSGEILTALVNDVIKPDICRIHSWEYNTIFRHLLFPMCMDGASQKKNARLMPKSSSMLLTRIPSIVNLKLEAEAAYVVKSTDISLNNAVDNLLYADSRNCALLKEAVMNFLADNHYKAAEKISFDDVPDHVVKDLLIVFGRNSKKDANGTNVDELTSICVSALRRKPNGSGS